MVWDLFVVVFWKLFGEVEGTSKLPVCEGIERGKAGWLEKALYQPVRIPIVHWSYREWIARSNNIFRGTNRQIVGCWCQKKKPPETGIFTWGHTWVENWRRAEVLCLLRGSQRPGLHIGTFRKVWVLCLIYVINDNLVIWVKCDGKNL